MKSDIITGLRVDHHVATPREITTAHPFGQHEFINYLVDREEISEAFVLQTCNRSEAYVVTSDSITGRSMLANTMPDVTLSRGVWMDHEDCIRHLLRVVSGLESQVLGEDQIIGQFKTAFREASNEGGVGELLEEILLKSIHVGERVRSETRINEGVTSLGGAAVELLDQECDLRSATALVIGAGELSTLAARALSRKHVHRMYIANRTIDRAECVANQLAVDARGMALAGLPSRLSQVDVIVTATSSIDPILCVNDFQDVGETIVIDLANPNDIEKEVRNLEEITVFDLNDLKQVTEQTHKERQEATGYVEELLDNEFDLLLNQLKSKQVDDIIGQIHKQANKIKKNETSRAINRLKAEDSLSTEQAEIINEFSDSLVNKILTNPTKSLRVAACTDDWTTINSALRLFDQVQDTNSVETEFSKIRVASQQDDAYCSKSSLKLFKKPK